MLVRVSRPPNQASLPPRRRSSERLFGPFGVPLCPAQCTILTIATLFTIDNALQNRRALLSAAAAAALVLKAEPSMAAFGDSANIFGKITNPTGFVPYAGEGFSLLLPSKWNPSKEREFPNMVLRYEASPSPRERMAFFWFWHICSGRSRFGATAILASPEVWPTIPPCSSAGQLRCR